MSPDIVTFITKQSCATVCCVDENNEPYCFNCFYIFNKDAVALYFKSSEGSRHYALLEKFTTVAGSILPDKLQKLLVQGIQFEGNILHDDDLLVKNAAAWYHKKNPMAIAIPGKIWVIQLQHIKMTDNTKGFGTKIEWHRKPQL